MVGGILGSRKSRWSNLFKSSYVQTILLAVIVVGSVVAFWFGVQVAFRTQYPLLTVASGSMSPTLNVGDLIVVQGVLNASDLKAGPNPEGDIVVFRSPRTEGELIVHRAVHKEPHEGLWYIQTKGDASTNPSPDIWSGTGTWNGMISERLLIGRVVGKAPWLGYVPLYIRTPSGMILIIFLIILIIVAEYIPALFKKQTPTEG